MNVEEIRNYCLLKKGAEEGFPFGSEVLVFKKGGKIFVLLSLDASPPQFNAKCDPDRAEELRGRYAAIIPGYHMNKKHWNTVICDGTLPAKLIRELIDHSYELILKTLPKKGR